LPDQAASATSHGCSVRVSRLKTGTWFCHPYWASCDDGFHPEPGFYATQAIR
jgi:hypothetical protein